MHFVFGSITTALLRPVCPGRPRRSGKKGQSERKKGKWRLGRGTQRGQMESGKRPCKVKQEWDKNTSVFLMPRICDKERERTKRLFGARLLNSICVSVFFYYRACLSSTAVQEDLQEGWPILLFSISLFSPHNSLLSPLLSPHLRFASYSGVHFSEMAGFRSQKK